MVKQNKRGQAAMEFLMTYGWAILVVLAAIGALAYFGVLSPDNFLPSKCTISPQFACKDWKVNSDGTILLQIQNNVGSTTSANISLSNDPSTCAVSGGDPLVEVAGVRNGADFGGTSGLIQINCTSGNTLVAGSKFAADITVVYWDPAGSGLTHTATGSLQAKVE